eukprot:COSAG06_NODE_257_length_18972_cov_14.659196_3_plen_128_part_00
MRPLAALGWHSGSRTRAVSFAPFLNLCGLDLQSTRSNSRLHDRVRDHTNALNLALHNIAGLKPDLRVAEAADAGRGAGEDEVTRLHGHETAACRCESGVRRAMHMALPVNQYSKRGYRALSIATQQK